MIKKEFLTRSINCLVIDQNEYCLLSVRYLKLSRGYVNAYIYIYIYSELYIYIYIHRYVKTVFVRYINKRYIIYTNISGQTCTEYN